MIAELSKIIKSLERPNGELRPEDVVNAARDPESPLHSHFEWDDSKAAHAYRLSQARGLIRKVRVDVTYHQVTIKAPAYVRDPDLGAKVPGYVCVQRLRTDEDRSRRALVEAMNSVVNANRRAKALAVALGVEDEVETIDRIATGVVSKIDITKSAPAGAA